MIHPLQGTDWDSKALGKASRLRDPPNLPIILEHVSPTCAKTECSWLLASWTFVSSKQGHLYLTPSCTLILLGLITETTFFTCLDFDNVQLFKCLDFKDTRFCICLAPQSSIEEAWLFLILLWDIVYKISRMKGQIFQEKCRYLSFHLSQVQFYLGSERKQAVCSIPVLRTWCQVQ